MGKANLKKDDLKDSKIKIDNKFNKIKQQALNHQRDQTFRDPDAFKSYMGEPFDMN